MFGSIRAKRAAFWPARRTGKWAGVWLLVLLACGQSYSPRAVAAETDSLRASDQRQHLASLPSGSAAPDRAIEPPVVLSSADAARYRQIFRFQESANWAAADRLINQLSDPLLKGHVLAQRYLHAKAPRPTATELREWMAAYADHPAARDIYKVARKAQPRGAKPLRAPVGGYLHGTGSGSGSLQEAGVCCDFADSLEDGNSNERTQVSQTRAKLRAFLRQGATKSIKAVLTDPKTKSLLTSGDFDKAAAALAFAYFIDGEDEMALSWARPAAERSGHIVPAAHWAAGLASFRQKRFAQAAKHFEALANSRRANDWLAAAGAFWAARTNLKAHRPEVFTHWLTVASSYPRTFYGLMARRLLGVDTYFDFDETPLTETEAALLQESDAGRRALALIQVDRVEWAETELRKLYPRAGAGMVRAMLALAQNAGMPGLALRLGALAADNDGRRHDGAFYPIPRWQPEGGWRIDRALVYAFMRQESGFNENAKSGRGARGLMQVMPATARFVSGESDRERLTDPEFNIDVGQRYLAQLLKEEPVRGNLLLLAAAYNRGPGRLARWMQTAEYGDDPLLFMESLPSRETRAFVERVIANLWVYQTRLGQAPESLDALAEGRWPLYRQPESQPRLSAAERRAR